MAIAIGQPADSERRRKSAICSLHRVLAQALREGRVRQNVAAVADKPKATRREMRFLTSDQIARLFAVAEGTRVFRR